MSFWGELKRRNVVKVGIAYAVAAWLIVHPVDIIFPTLHLPEWTTTFVTALFIIGFPFVLIFAWVYEVTPKGLKRTKQVPRAQSITQLTGKKLNYIITGLLVVAVAYIVIDKFYIDRRAPETKQVPAVVEAVKVKKTIAVLPFTDLSPAKDQEYFVDGLSEELLNTLTQIQDLRVTARTSSFSFKGSNKTVQEIANVLGVENILEGSVRKAGNALRITAQLVNAVDGSHLWSKTYDRELKDIFAVQEDIATAVSNELKATLGIGKSLRPLGGTENVEAYELYLVSKGQAGKTPAGETRVASMSHTLESLDAALALDPKFAMAWATKANMHGGLIVFGPANLAASERDVGLRAALKAIELEPNLAAGYAALGNIKSSKGDWIEAGLAFRKALELQTEPLSGNEMFSAIHNNAVGYFKKSHEILEEIRQNDPLAPDARAHYILSLAFLGEIQQSEEEYERGKAIIGDPWSLGDMFITDIRLGFTEVMSRDEIVYSDPIWDAAKDRLDSPKEGLAELRHLYSDYHNLSSSEITDISIWAAYFGDPEFAMDAMEKGYNIEASGFFKIWLPVMKEVRQTPRFKALIKKIGLVDYWNKFGWPDICHKLDNGDFVCD